MPFSVQSTEAKEDSYFYGPLGCIQLVSYEISTIDISDIDREHDRLSIVVICDGETGEFRFSLETDQYGKYQLRLDREHSDEKALDWMQSLAEELLPSLNFEGLPIFYNLYPEEECQECNDGSDTCEPLYDQSDSTLKVYTPFSVIIKPEWYEDGAAYGLSNVDGSEVSMSIGNFTASN